MALKYHLMNTVKVNAPRWSTRDILPRLDKFKPGYNLMTVNHANYPGKYIIHSKQLENYPTEVVHSKKFGDYQVKAMPLNELRTIQENELENETIKHNLLTWAWWK